MWLLRLIRWPNLLIIILTQVLVRYCVVIPFMRQAGAVSHFTFPLFWILVLITVLLAAAGYIINDYFDLRIDRINKPGKMILGKRIEPRVGILLHWLFNVIATMLGFYLAYKVGSLRLGLVFPLIAGILYMYSARYKRSLLVGNLVVSWLSAMVPLMVWLFEFYMIRNLGHELSLFASKVSVVVWYYAAFAFLVSFVRELVKDVEDLEGDREAGCRTIPVMAGTATAKSMAMVATIFTMFVLATGQYLALLQGLKIIFWYYVLPVQLMMINLLLQINKSSEPVDFRVPGNLAKMIMVAGVLGMQLFCLTIR